MALDRADLREEVDKNLGGRREQQDPAYTRLDRHLDLTLTRLGRAHEWKEMSRLDSDSVVITGTPSIDATYDGLPVTLKELYGLMVYASGDQQAHKLSRLPNRQWDQMIGPSNLHEIGEITHYMMWERTGVGQSGGPSIEWFRVPDANYTLYRRYTVWPSMGALTTDLPTLNNKDDLIIANCTHWLFQSAGERDNAATWYAIASSLMEEALAEDALQPDVDVLPRRISEDGRLVEEPWNWDNVAGSGTIRFPY